MAVSELENAIALGISLLATASVLAYAYEKSSFYLRERCVSTVVGFRRLVM
jgi:hypothetical protein